MWLIWYTRATSREKPTGREPENTIEESPPQCGRAAEPRATGRHLQAHPPPKYPENTQKQAAIPVGCPDSSLILPAARTGKCAQASPGRTPTGKQARVKPAEPRAQS